MTTLIRPTRVYFDTANLQDLAAESSASTLRTAFHRVIDKGVLLPVVSFIHLIEIANKPDHIRENMLRLLDPIARDRRLLWVRCGGPVLDHEFRRALSHEGNGRLPPADMFSMDIGRVLRAKRTVACAGSESPLREMIGTLLDPIVGQAVMKKHRAAVDHGLAALADFKKRRKLSAASNPRFSTDHKHAIILSRAAASGAMAGLPGSDPGVRLDVSRMPAHEVWIGFEEGAVRGSQAIDDTDMEDRWHLPSAVYADVFFCDKRIYERLRVAGTLPPHARRNSEFPTYLAALDESCGGPAC
jgi:hypothetical protein